MNDNVLLEQTEIYEIDGAEAKTEAGYEFEHEGAAPLPVEKVFQKEYSPGSSPERGGLDTESIILQEAASSSSNGADSSHAGGARQVVNADATNVASLSNSEDDEKNIATYNRPPNSDISSIMRQRNSSNHDSAHNGSTPIVQLPKMKKRNPSEPFKRPVVIMQPPALRNEPM
jgi:hypothetical protein